MRFTRDWEYRHRRLPFEKETEQTMIQPFRRFQRLAGLAANEARPTDFHGKKACVAV